MKSSPIHVVFITDSAYVVPTAVAIRSLRDSRDSGTELAVHVLARGLSTREQDIFRRLADERLTMDLREGSNDDILDGLSGADGHVSSSALQKFHLADIFSDLDRILYLDGDVLIGKDLSALWQTDLGNAYLAAVPDFKMMERKITGRLGLNRDTYFNSGVMLLNLARWREERMGGKLVDYKLHGKNFFMDQDAFNAVLGGDVRWLSVVWNFETFLLNHAYLPALKAFYHGNDMTLEDLAANAAIVHFHAWCKPWICYNVPGAVGWKTIHDKLFPGRPLRRKMLPFDERTRRFPQAELLGEPVPPRPQVVVSLTSHPARIRFVAATVRSVFRGTVLPDAVEVWLGRDKFPGGEADLPEALCTLVDSSEGRVSLRWIGRDVGPATKLLPALAAHPEAAVVTVDDDQIYPETMLEKLLASFGEYPRAVSACRAHLMIVDNGRVLPYSEWPQDVSGLVDAPSHQLLATGVGGVLYPPGVFSRRIHDVGTMQCLTPRNDDLWFKAVELLEGIPVVQAGPIPLQTLQPGSRGTGLMNENVVKCGNDVPLAALVDWVERESGRSVRELLVQDGLASVLSIRELNAFYRAALPDVRSLVRHAVQRTEEAKAKKLYRSTWSYRIGNLLLHPLAAIRRRFRT